MTTYVTITLVLSLFLKKIRKRRKKKTPKGFGDTVCDSKKNIIKNLHLYSTIIYIYIVL